MSKRKGLSADEKRKVILDIYHGQKEPFNLKEIEQLASKRGVVLQTVKIFVNDLFAFDFITDQRSKQESS
jgi:hypothetical protein